MKLIRRHPASDRRRTLQTVRELPTASSYVPEWTEQARAAPICRQCHSQIALGSRRLDRDELPRPASVQSDRPQRRPQSLALDPLLLVRDFAPESAFANDAAPAAPMHLRRPHSANLIHEDFARKPEKTLLKDAESAGNVRFVSGIWTKLWPRRPERTEEANDASDEQEESDMQPNVLPTRDYLTSNERTMDDYLGYVESVPIHRHRQRLRRASAISDARLHRQRERGAFDVQSRPSSIIEALGSPLETQTRRESAGKQESGTTARETWRRSCYSEMGPMHAELEAPELIPPPLSAKNTNRQRRREAAVYSPIARRSVGALSNVTVPTIRAVEPSPSPAPPFLHGDSRSPSQTETGWELQPSRSVSLCSGASRMSATGDHMDEALAKQENVTALATLTSCDEHVLQPEGGFPPEQREKQAGEEQRYAAPGRRILHRSVPESGTMLEAREQQLDGPPPAKKEKQESMRTALPEQDAAAAQRLPDEQQWPAVGGQRRLARAERIKLFKERKKIWQQRTKLRQVKEKQQGKQGRQGKLQRKTQRGTEKKQPRYGAWCCGLFG